MTERGSTKANLSVEDALIKSQCLRTDTLKSVHLFRWNVINHRILKHFSLQQVSYFESEDRP